MDGERCYEYLAEAGVRNVKGYNALTRAELFERFLPASEEEEARIPKKLPYIVIMIDELADLMMTSGKEVEAHIVRLAQKSRAVGIHLVLATQRPQANVVTGLIKSNMPSRIAFRVSSKMDSRIVLDQNGADLLLGQGDMLFLPPGASKPIRSQGTFIDDREIRESIKIVHTLAEAGNTNPELVQIKGENGDDDRRDGKRRTLQRRRPHRPGNQTRQREFITTPPHHRLRPRQPSDRANGRDGNRRRLQRLPGPRSEFDGGRMGRDASPGAKG